MSSSGTRASNGLPRVLFAEYPLNRWNLGGKERRTRALAAALERDGWNVQTIRLHDTFARLVAEIESGIVEVDLAVDSPPLFALTDVDGIPVLALEDLAARKILAILDRAESRDFTDLLSLADRFSPEECVAWARQLDEGITSAAIANAFGKLGRLEDHELPTEAPDRLRAVFARWSDELRAT